MKEIHLNSQNFENTVLKSEKPVLVDFWAEWCGPCVRLGPIISEIADEMHEKIIVAKVNVDQNNELASKYQIMSIPTMKIFKNGKIAGEIIGAAPKQAILAEINKHL